jgi:hypothetical protein
MKADEEMMNDECGVMNEKKLLSVHHSSFRIHHLFFVPTSC